MKKKVKNYEYHIFYVHKDGSGSCAIGFKKKIKCHEDIFEIKKCIEKENNIQDVGIVNFQLLGVRKIEEVK